MILIGAAIFASAFLLSCAGTFVVRQTAPRLGLVDQPAARKLHARPMPLGGGLAICASVTLVVSAAILLPLLNGNISWMPELISRNIDLMAGKLPTLLTILGGGIVITAVGMADDVRGLRPRTRLLAEAAVAAGIFWLSPDLRITAFTPMQIASFVYTIVWITAITNAFNLLDNMDGLTGGVACVSGLIFLIVAVQTGQLFVAALLTALIGGIAGFLVFNFPPASIFMGDAGALFIGYMMAVLTVIFTFYDPARGIEAGMPPKLNMLLPLIILAVPLFDTLSVVVIRLKTGQPIFKADKRHFSHRLVSLGMSRRQAVFTIYLVTFCTGIGATFWHSVSPTGSILIFAQVVATIGLIIILEITAGRIAKPSVEKPVE